MIPLRSFFEPEGLELSLHAGAIPVNPPGENERRAHRRPVSGQRPEKRPVHAK